MDRLYGGVCYAGIDTDPELKYPKGAGRVAFSNQQSYIAAISARFVQLQHGDIDKRVEVKPYVLDDQMCDECQGQRCGGKFAPFFCANVTCLQVSVVVVVIVRCQLIFLGVAWCVVYFIVLLWTLLGNNSFPSGSGIPQAAGEGGCRQTEGGTVSLVLTQERLVQQPPIFSLLPSAVQLSIA